jgi:hypothetical protein
MTIQGRVQASGEVVGSVKAQLPRREELDHRHFDLTSLLCDGQHSVRLLTG